MKVRDPLLSGPFFQEVSGYFILPAEYPPPPRLPKGALAQLSGEGLASFLFLDAHSHVSSPQCCAWHTRGAPLVGTAVLAAYSELAAKGEKPG